MSVLFNCPPLLKLLKSKNFTRANIDADECFSCRPSIAAAIHGCEVLLRQADQTSQQSMSAADARVMATAFADDVDVPGMAVALRQPALRVLHLLLEVTPDALSQHVTWVSTPLTSCMCTSRRPCDASSPGRQGRMFGP